MPGLIGRTHHDRQGEVLEAARSRRESRRDARLLLRGAAPPAPERQAWHRRRGDREEAARDAVQHDAAAGRQARRPGEAGAAGESRGSCPRGADPQGRDAGPARRDHAAGPAARGPAAEARRGREAALDEDRVVPQPEGSDQGAVLGRGGAGARSARRRPGSAARCPMSGSRSSARRTRLSRCRRAPTRSAS